MMKLHALACALVPILAPISFAGDWPSWRGPDGTGMAQGSAPLHWSDDSGVRWKLRIPGRGFSTPIFTGGRLFLTTAVETNKPAPPEGEAVPPDKRNEGFLRERAKGRFGEQRFAVLCVDAESGELAWATPVHRAWPHEGHHAQYGSYASRSPVTDGEHVFASFGSWGIYCLDLEGKLVWEVDPGIRLEMRHGHGEGSAPVLSGNTLVHLFDQEVPGSFIAAWDKNTGEELWRTPREEVTTWAQPIVVSHDGRMQVIAAGETAVRGYDLATGKELWQRSGLGRAVISTPIYTDGVVISMTNFTDPGILAIRLGGEGVLPDESIAWRSARGSSYTETPLLHGRDLYVTDDRGFISCFDALTGEGHYVQQRLPRGTELKASPLGVDGRIYIATESGDVHVLAMTPEKVEVLATNTLTDQSFIASPIAVNGALYLRSLEFLYRIDGAEAPTGNGDER